MACGSTRQCPAHVLSFDENYPGDIAYHQSYHTYLMRPTIRLKHRNVQGTRRKALSKDEEGCCCDYKESYVEETPG